MEGKLLELQASHGAVLDAIGSLTREVAEVKDAIKSPPRDSNQYLREELAKVRSELVEERRRTHSDWRELSRQKLEWWKITIYAIGLMIAGGGGVKLLEAIAKGLGH